MEAQLLGGELTSLFPRRADRLRRRCAVVARKPARTRGRHRTGRLCDVHLHPVRPVPDYSRYDGNNERFFPLYLALVMLGGWLVWRAWHQLWAGRIANLTSAGCRRLRRTLIADGAVGIAWVASIVSVMTDGPTARIPRAFHRLLAVRLMDLGFIIPFGLTTGVADSCVVHRGRRVTPMRSREHRRSSPAPCREWRFECGRETIPPLRQLCWRSRRLEPLPSWRCTARSSERSPARARTGSLRIATVTIAVSAFPTR